MSDLPWIIGNFEEGLVSIIIPVFNRSEYLVEAIDSVMNQTYRSLECIVIDDGSTENIKGIIDQYIDAKKEGISIVYLYQQNSGPQVARNSGTKIAKGEFFQYFDSDDILYPDKLKSQVIFLQNNELCDGVFADWESGTKENKKLNISDQEDDMISRVLVGKGIANFSFLIRRRIIQKTKGWDIHLKTNHEIDFYLSALMAGAIFSYQPLTSGLWRAHDGIRFENTTSLKELLDFYSKWEKILEEKKLFSTEIAQKMGNLMMWFITQNKKTTDEELLKFLKKATSFNPNILGYKQSRKIKVLKHLVGFENAFKIWSHPFRKSIMNPIER